MTSSTDPKTLRERHLREIRLVIPDARSPEVRRRIAAEVARLSKADEEDAMRWIEAVSGADKSPDEAARTDDDPRSE